MFWHFLIFNYGCSKNEAPFSLVYNNEGDAFTYEHILPDYSISLYKAVAWDLHFYRDGSECGQNVLENKVTIKAEIVKISPDDYDYANDPNVFMCGGPTCRRTGREDYRVVKEDFELILKCVCKIKTDRTDWTSLVFSRVDSCLSFKSSSNEML